MAYLAVELHIYNTTDQAKGCYACGDDYANSPLDASLLWHFGYWQLRGLFESVDMTSDQASQSSKDV